jgi:hypothetical protein
MIADAVTMIIKIVTAENSELQGSDRCRWWTVGDA